MCRPTSCGPNTREEKRWEISESQKAITSKRDGFSFTFHTPAMGRGAAMRETNKNGRQLAGVRRGNQEQAKEPPTMAEENQTGADGQQEPEQHSPAPKDVNNAKHYAQQSAASATTAGQKADAAMEHADSAETSQKAAEAAAARALLGRSRQVNFEVGVRQNDCADVAPVHDDASLARDVALHLE